MLQKNGTTFDSDRYRIFTDKSDAPTWEVEKIWRELANLRPHTAGATAVAWEAVIPSMGAMALVRNVPSLPGSTLILVHRSGSMFFTTEGWTKLTRAGCAAPLRGESAG